MVQDEPVRSPWLPRGLAPSLGNGRPSRCTPPSDVEAMAKLITTFLELRHLESPVELSQSSDSEPDGPAGQS